MPNMKLSDIYIANPATSIGVSDLLYISQSPYASGDDAAMTGGSLGQMVQKQSFVYGTDAGMANAYVLTLSYPISSYTDGLMISFLASNTNTNASTINVDAKGVADIKSNANTPLTGGEIVAGRQYYLIYSSTLTSFILLNSSLYTITGDVGGSGPWNNIPVTLGNNVVTYAKMQQASASRLLGNPTGSPANISEISLGSGLSFSGTSVIVSSAALTKTDDTNVTLTLGGTPASALLAATSLTLGWTGQLAVPRGGSGLASATAYAVLCGGTTSTDPFQSIASVGTSGQVLTSNGAGALPTFQNASGGGATQVLMTVFTSSGTYTPQATMIGCWIRAVGGGGGGGGSNTDASTQSGAAGGGGAGAYAEGVYSRSTIIGGGTDASITIGAAGTGGAAGNNDGTAGGTTTVIANSGAGSTLISVGGGSGGSRGTARTIDSQNLGGAGGVATTGTFKMNGADGQVGQTLAPATTAGTIWPGAGGSSLMGISSYWLGDTTVKPTQTGYGNGGGGGASPKTGLPMAGCNGGKGIVVIIEWY